jgi:hypothetical protein
LVLELGQRNVRHRPQEFPQNICASISETFRVPC